MKKLKLFLSILFLSGLMLGVSAQDTIRSLIFSEAHTNGRFDHYMELANTGTTTLDLSNFSIGYAGSGDPFTIENGLFRADFREDKHLWLSGTLAPGETWTMMNVGDNLTPEGLPYHRLDIMAKADTLIHGTNSTGWVTDTIPEWEVWGFDSIDDQHSLAYNEGKYCYVLMNHLDNGDYVMIDQYNMNLNDDLEQIKEYVDVAGIEGATGTHTLVRKATVKVGNMNWAFSRGVDLEDSEWIPIPSQPYRRSFTTFGTHGDFHVNLESSVVDIDKPNAKMNVPWGVYKGDSILNLMTTIGPGQGWEFIEDSSFIDSTHSIIQDGDVLRMYAAGNELELVDFFLTIMDAAPDEARVFPMRVKRFSNDVPPIGFWEQPHYVTHGEPIIDTIGNVAYATRVDSLYKYLEKASLANWEIVWKDDVVRADLQNGDILKVTAENGTTIKEYYIDVQDYVLSNNVNLAAITWPDKSEFIENWMDDTIPEFDPVKTLYTVTLPYGTKNVPALVAHPQNVNSQLEVKRATSVSGSLESRSTIFTITSESDTITKEYTVIFKVEKDPADVQTYQGTPFISEIVMRKSSAMSFLEIVNPGNVDMDLSEYLIMQSDYSIPAEALQDLDQDPTQVDEDDFQYRYRGYVPGYQYRDDTTSWLIEPGILSVDGNLNPTVKPGDVFAMCATSSQRSRYYTPEILAKLDKQWDGVDRTSYDPTGTYVRSTPPYLLQGANGVYIFRIENDSVLEGKKPVGDPGDYTLVDAFADPVADETFYVAGEELGSRYKGRIRTKPHVYTGARSVLESAERFGTNADDSYWIVENDETEPDYIGSHLMDPVTVYKSTLTSPVYLVSEGFAGVQTIQGDLTSTTVETFFGNLIKADTAQVLSVHSGSDGSVKDAGAAVAGTDTLVVVSADGKNTTVYALTDIPLDDDAVLTLVDDPSDYTISITENSGTITGVEYGSPIKDVVAAVNVPTLAVMNIINGAGELVPLMRMDNHEQKVETKVGDDIYFEVIAQDKVTKITYKLEPAALSSDAFVISSLYSVDQDNDLIEGLADSTSTEHFFRNIEVVEGATTKLLTKLGHERMDGPVAYDDVLQVVSEDGTVTRTYFITFVNETTPDSNGAPEITLAFSDSTIAVPGTLMLSATANDDGLPPPANLTYTWEVTSDNAADVVIETPDAPETNVTFNVKADYTLSLSVSDGALTSTADVAVTVGFVGVNNSIAPAINLYPNPANSKLTIELANMPEQTSVVSFYNITGSVVYNGKLTEMTNEIDVSGFESGLYFIKIDSGKKSFTHRIQIQN